MTRATMVQRLLGRAEQIAIRSIRDAGDSAFWKDLYFRHVWRRPFWLTDKYGVTLRVHPDGSMKRILAGHSHFDDQSVLELTRRIVTSGMTVFDVGANVGQFSLFTAKLLERDGRIHAFEPVASSFERLIDNVHHSRYLADRISLNRMAVGSSNGFADMYLFPPGYSVWNSLSCHTMQDRTGPVEPSEIVQVPIITLDSYCTGRSIARIDLMKIDVEGFELEVLQGCSQLIKKRSVHNVIFEISLEPLKGTGRYARDILQAISDMGFEIRHILPQGRLEKVELSYFEVPYFSNYLATPRQN